MNHFPRILRVALLAAPVALAACGVASKADPTPMGSAGSVSFVIVRPVPFLCPMPLAGTIV